MVVATFLGTILGGLISGIIGVGLFHYKTEIDERKEVIAWYDRTIQIARYTQEATPNEGVDGEERKQVQEVYDTIHSTLLNHATNTPAGVDTDVFSDIDDLSTQLRMMRKYGVGGFKGMSFHVYSYANDLEDKARKKREAFRASHRSRIQSWRSTSESTSPSSETPNFDTELPD